jgi:alpha-ketoglutarate-dependent taurine dioxygenase
LGHPSPLSIHPLTQTIGAEVRGVDLTAALDTADVANLRHALPDHLVLLFRDQEIGPEQQLRFSERFGPVMIPTIDTTSSSLLAVLFEHIKNAAFQCRFLWEVDSVAFWDNRCTQHLAIPDYSERRLMQRTMIEGDRPFGVAERRAVAERD